MDFKLLQSYAAVVECQSFTKAAQRLFVSQPTVSAHVRALEEELGADLIVRTTKRIDETAKGKEVYQDALSILLIRDRMIQRCAHEENRIIRIAASTIPASYMLPEILPEFGRQFPHIYFSIHRTEIRGVLNGLSEGSFDMGFATQSADEGLMSIPICRDRMILITPVNETFLQMQAEEELSMRRFLEHPIILREKTLEGEKLADRYLAEMKIDEKEMKVVARANDQESVKNLVAGGMGISLISHMAARGFIEEKRVLHFELPVQSEKTIYLLCRKTDWPQEHIQRFAQYVQKKYESKKD